jgi:cysteinyl-tRNA synthetase
MNIINGLMELILEIRKKARESKNWTTADLIRNKLKDMNIVLEDRQDGTKWKIISH